MVKNIEKSKNNKSEKQSSNWKKIALTFAIAIIFILFIGFGIEAFYDSPKYDDFCERDNNPKFHETKESCELNDGDWEINERIPTKLRNNEFVCSKGIEDETGEFTFNCKSNDSESLDSGFCDMYSSCGEEYDSVRDVYNRNVFIICIIIGFIAIFSGVTLRKESVGTGILVGGVLTVLYGTARYWSELGEIVRFLLLGAILVLLIYLGYKKVKD